MSKFKRYLKITLYMELNKIKSREDVWNKLKNAVKGLLLFKTEIIHPVVIKKHIGFTGDGSFDTTYKKQCPKFLSDYGGD